jgi:hypothetical protein
VHDIQPSQPFEIVQLGGIGLEARELKSCTVGIIAFNLLFIFMRLILLLPVLSVSVILRVSQYKLSRQYQ